jgi:hypothetical protein
MKIATIRVKYRRELLVIEQGEKTTQAAAKWKPVKDGT